MKKIVSLLLICTMLASISFTVNAEGAAWKEYYVSIESGSDSNPGTKDAPFKTIQAAKAAVRTINKSMQGDIIVNIESGTYYLDDTLDFTNDDSAYNGHRIYYRGIGNEKPIFSGGIQVKDFRLSEYDSIWVADFDDDAPLQLSVGGIKRYTAKASHGIKGVQMSAEYLATEFADPANPFDYNDPDPSRPWKYDGLRLNKSDFGIYDNIEDVLFQWEVGFLTYVYNVVSVKEDPDSADHLLVTLDPSWNSERMNNGYKHSNPKKLFTVMNAMELLDEPGEFYYNKETHKLYYMPVDGEVMNQTPVVVPLLETIVRLDGNDVDDKIKNITFENIQFSDAKLDFHDGFETHQATAFYGSGFTDHGPSAFYAMRTEGIDIRNCIFSNIGGNGIWMSHGNEKFNIVGNALYDIGDSGIVVGERNHNDQTFGSAKTPVTNFEAALKLDQDGVTDPVPEDKKNAAVNLMMDPDTRLWFSQYSSGSTVDPHVATYVDSKNSVVDSNPLAVIYPGYPDADHHAEAKGYQAQKNHITYMEDLNDLRTKGQLYKGVWRDVYSKFFDKVPYVIAEFVRPYTIDEITITFDPSKIKPGEDSDYEVLVSNDKSFADGTYKVIHTQNGKAPSDVNTYVLGDGVKYKYLMVRKLRVNGEIGDLALSRMYVTTHDRKPWVKSQFCENFNIENNLLDRIGYEVGRAVGIGILGGRNGNLLHNEIADTSYTGISVGLVWSNLKASTRNMKVGYNYAHDNGKLHVDGSSSYFLGWQPGLEIYKNLLVNPKNSRINIYMDLGSRGAKIYGNYEESAQCLESVRPQGGESMILENTLYGNFSTQVKTWVLATDVNDYTPHTQEVMGQPSREAYDTYMNAGLEPEYKYLKDYVTNNGDNFYSTYAYQNKDVGERQEDMDVASSTEAFKYLVENGEFGNGLGMYPMETKAMAEEVLDYLSGKNVSDISKRTVRAEYMVNEIKKTLNRYSLTDTFAICEDTLAKAKGEDAASYIPGAVIEFEKTLNSLMSVSIDSPEIEYDVLTSLEKAYNKLVSKKYSDRIIRATMPGTLDYVVNDETNTVVMHLKKGSDFKTDELQIETEGNAPIAYEFLGSQNLKEGIKVPVYNKGTKKYRLWTVKAAYEEPIIKTMITKDTGWITDSFEKFYMKKGTDFICLAGSDYAYMSEVHGGDEETTINFSPYSCNRDKSFSLLLGAKRAEGFDYSSKSSDYNRCEVEFKDNTATFYKVINGTKTEIDVVTSGIKWNEKNELKYKIMEINDNAHFTITINGKMIFSEVVLPSDACGRYMGFYTPSMNIRVY